MEGSKSKICPALWFSGFFGFGALLHLFRFVFRISLVVGGHTAPFWLSGAAVIVFGGLSAGLLLAACRKPCEKH